MSKLETWISNQNPNAAKGMTALNGIDCLHISTNPRLGRMAPRVGNRQIKSEDRTIPRISGSETLVGCIYGHSEVRSVSNLREEFNGNEWVDNELPIFHIYRLNIEELVRPSKKLVQDAVRTKELWIVPYSPEACNVRPERMGQLIMKKSVDVFSGATCYRMNTFVLRVNCPFKLDGEVIPVGHYQFDLNGSLNLTAEGTANKVENLKSISGAEYAGVLQSFAK